MKKISIKNLNPKSAFLILLTTALSSATLSDLFYGTVEVAENHMIGLFLQNIFHLSMSLFTTFTIFLVLYVFLFTKVDWDRFFVDFAQDKHNKSNATGDKTSA